MPSRTPLDDLIRKGAETLRADAAQSQIDWAERRIWWQGRVNDLYSDILEWFEPLIADKVVGVQRDPFEIHEAELGIYTAESLTLLLEPLTFKIAPVGTLVAGGFGRADVIGRAGRAMLLLAPEDDTSLMPERRDESIWFLVRPQSHTRLIEISEMSFKQLFADLMSLSL